MAAKPPPVPPEQQGPHGAKEGAKVDEGKAAETRNDRERNLDQQGRQGNIKQNINNQGQQQDR
jgi:hypothetical protein